MPVDDWFWSRWLPEHRTRHERVGLPTIDSDAGVELFNSWRSNFIHRGISDYAVANDASVQLVGEKLPHSSEHFPRLVEIAIGIYRARNVAETGGVEPSSFEAAKLASLSCEFCGGHGMTCVYHPQPDHARKVPESAASHCLCPAGRWIRRQCAEKDAHSLKRIIDFREAWEGRNGWQTRPLIGGELVERIAACEDAAEAWMVLKRHMASVPMLKVLPKATVKKPWIPGDPILEKEPRYGRRDVG